MQGVKGPAPGQAEPPRTEKRATGDMGYLKFGVFPGDNGCFSITLCAPEVEEEMRKAIVDPEVFDRICREIPGMEPWVDPARARPRSLSRRSPATRSAASHHCGYVRNHAGGADANEVRCADTCNRARFSIARR